MSNSDLIIIGIDPSLTATAACFLEADGKHDAVVYREPATGLDLQDRMIRYEALVSRIVEGVRNAMPAQVFIEGYSYGSKGKGTLTRAEYGGILRRDLMHVCVVTEVPPASLKLFVTGKGNANKTAVITALVKRYGVEFGTDDEYDAYGLAKMGECILKRVVPANEAQRRAVNKLQED